jgi:hypothetical protein
VYFATSGGEVNVIGEKLFWKISNTGFT